MGEASSAAAKMAAEARQILRVREAEARTGQLQKQLRLVEEDAEAELMVIPESNPQCPRPPNLRHLYDVQMRMQYQMDKLRTGHGVGCRTNGKTISAHLMKYRQVVLSLGVGRGWNPRWRRRGQLRRSSRRGVET